MNADQAHVLLVLALGVFLAPPLAAALRIPAAVAEMVYGAVVVALLPSLRHLPSFVSFLQQFGFLLVLFLAGMELDLRALVSAGWGRVLRAMPFGIVVPVGAMLGAALIGKPPVVGLIVGTISIGLSSRLLADMGLLRTRLGQVAVVTGGIGEVVTIIGITVLTDTAGGVNGMRLAVSLGQIAAVFAAGIVVIALLRDLAWWRPAWFAALLRDEDTNELGLRSSLGLLCAFGALAVLLHVPGALAAFVAGQTLALLFPLHREGGISQPVAQLRGKIRSLGFAFFVPVAFITVGQELDFHVFTRPGPLALGLGMTLASGLTRFVAMPLLRLQVDWEESLLVAIVLSESLTMKVTVATLAVSTHVMSAATLTPAVAATTAGDAIFPVLFKLVMARRQRREQQAAADPAPGAPAGPLRRPAGAAGG